MFDCIDVISRVFKITLQFLELGSCCFFACFIFAIFDNLLILDRKLSNCDRSRHICLVNRSLEYFKVVFVCRKESLDSNWPSSRLNSFRSRRFLNVY